MHPFRSLAHPVQGFVAGRLEGLLHALKQLADRVRDAIGDAVRAALDRRLSDLDDESPRHFDRERSTYRGYDDEDDEDEPRPYWGDPEPMDPWHRRERSVPAPSARSLTEWLPLIPVTLQGLTWLLRPLLARWPWLGAVGVVGVAAAALAATVLSGPLAGGLTGSAGIALMLLRLVDAVRDTFVAAAGLVGW